MSLEIELIKNKINIIKLKVHYAYYLCLSEVRNNSLRSSRLFGLNFLRETMRRCHAHTETETNP